MRNHILYQFGRRLLALAVAAVMAAVCAAQAFAASQYVNEDKLYDRIDDRNVYISADNYLYHFSGEIPGVTICGYKGVKTDLVIPEEINGRAVSAIDENVFAQDGSITSVTVPASVLAIGKGSFCGCKHLESVTLSNGVEKLEEVFCDCPRLKEIAIPDGVSEVNNSFRNCIALRSVRFSRTVTQLGDGSFNGCSSLEKIQWSTGLYYLGDVFDGSKMLTTIHIPKGIVTIDGAFDDCSFAEVLQLPDSLLYINSGFNRCTSLRDVNLPEGLVYIGSAFSDCKALENVTISAGTEVENAFENCPGVNIEKRSDRPHYVIITLLAALLLCGGGFAVHRLLSPRSIRKSPRKHTEEPQTEDYYNK